MNSFFYLRLLVCTFLFIPLSAQAESLRSAVRAAVTDNPAVRAATAEARASAFELLQLQGEYQPNLVLSGNAGAEWVDDPNSLTAEDNQNTKFRREIRAESELVLFDGQRRANILYANAARVDGSIFRLLDASETMALNATEVYIDVYRHLQLQAVATRTVARHREVGEMVANLVAAGRLPLSDQLQVNDRIRAAELALIDVRRAGRDAEARYTRIVGRKRKGSMSVPSIAAPVSSAEQLIKSAVDSSYRVRIAKVEVDRAGYEEKTVDADLQPRVTLNVGATTGEDIDGASGRQSDVFVGLRFNWTLYKGGRNARRNALIERQSKALSLRHQVIGEVREMAERTWNSYIASAERQQTISIQLAVNRALVEQFLSEFEAGTRSLLEVLEVERSLFDVEFAHVSADASLAFTRYRMLAAQSRLAEHFGIKSSDMALAPNFEERALRNQTAVFRTKIPPLE